MKNAHTVALHPEISDYQKEGILKLPEIKSCTHDGKFKKTPGYSIALLDAKME